MKLFLSSLLALLALIVQAAPAAAYVYPDAEPVQHILANGGEHDGVFNGCNGDSVTQYNGADVKGWEVDGAVCTVVNNPCTFYHYGSQNYYVPAQGVPNGETWQYVSYSAVSGSPPHTCHLEYFGGPDVCDGVAIAYTSIQVEVGVMGSC
ncbi:MAG TPA: hypothetical protein VFJ58_14705 [Armatimonadota bacterium]|nr:hypothetical protein [Armatimonadota bacterium]